jgi:predicted SAM-dependent methyltransferase
MDWDWHDPDQLETVMHHFTADLAHCDSLKPTTITPPYTQGVLERLGVTGIEFAAWKTTHPSGIGSDLIPLRCGDLSTEPGRLFQVDDERLFAQLDIAEPLPFETGCLRWVYAEHLIEHVSPPVAIGWLTEVRRVLGPGGLLRLTTPDLSTYVTGYLDGDAFFAKHRRRLRAAGVGPPMPARRAFMFNQLFYLYGHRWIYDLDELSFVLAEAGFEPERVRLRAFRDGARQDVAELDRVLRKDETMYVEVTA